MDRKKLKKVLQKKPNKLTMFLNEAVLRSKGFRGIITEDLSLLTKYSRFWEKLHKLTLDQQNIWLNSPNENRKATEGEDFECVLRDLQVKQFIKRLPIKKKSNRYAVCGDFADPLLLAKNFGLPLGKAGIYRTVKQDIIINTGSKSDLEITIQHELVHALDHLNNKSNFIDDHKFRSRNQFHKLLSNLYDNHLDEEKDKEVYRKIFNSLAVIIGDPKLAKRLGGTDPAKEIIAHTIPTLFKKWKLKTDTQEDRASYFILQHIIQDTYCNYIELELRDGKVKQAFEKKIDFLNELIEREKISNDDVDKCVIK